ncbi:hypothetical protein LI90_3296 [Carbonactinospora thermoautotrophica]|uniref:Uncharacterized protein n=1 Tax=Carbonactinospora thermoautotrophica TaxID=1469144 RepID=A0A132MWN6_9ACTN|nr:hypothetical protein LI90_3296 [Carbonactinospora thermoautotrophica]
MTASWTLWAFARRWRRLICGRSSLLVLQRPRKRPWALLLPGPAPGRHRKERPASVSDGR